LKRDYAVADATDFDRRFFLVEDEVLIGGEISHYFAAGRDEVVDAIVAEEHISRHAAAHADTWGRPPNNLDRAPLRRL
jgi:hypothetical protein